MNFFEPSFDLFSQFDKQIIFNGDAFFLRAQYFRFKIPQLRRDVPFGVRQRLLARIIQRHLRRLGVPHFNIISEYVIVADLERLDAGFRAFIFLERLQHKSTVARNPTVFIELIIVTVANDVAVANRMPRIFHQRPIEQFNQVSVIAQAVSTRNQNVAVHFFERCADRRDHSEGKFERVEIDPVGGTDFDLHHQPFNVPNVFEQPANLIAQRISVDKLLNAIQPTIDRIYIRQRRLDPFAQQARAHRRFRFVEHIEQRIFF